MESRLDIRVQLYLKASGALHEVYALYLHPDCAVNVFAVIYVRHLRQFIQYLVSGVPQIVGALYTACLDSADGVVQGQYLLPVVVDLRHLLLDLGIQIVLISGKSVIHRSRSLKELLGPLDQKPLSHGTGRILRKLLNGSPEIREGGLKCLTVHLAQLALHLLHDLG